MERQLWSAEKLPNPTPMMPTACGYYSALLPIPDVNGMFSLNHPPPILPIIFADLTGEPSRNPRYKTEICRNFKERSRCVYGDQCQFAHGRRELRDVVRNNKYKTKLCQKYWVAGYCVYGPRCNFLHDEDKQMAEMAAKEHGLVGKKRERSSSWSMEIDLPMNPTNTHASPVHLYDVDGFESLDCLNDAAYLTSQPTGLQKFSFDSLQEPPKCLVLDASPSSDL